MLRGISLPSNNLHMDSKHISDHDLERYYLGMVMLEAELAPLEEHILACTFCAERAEVTQNYVDAIRAAVLDYIDGLNV